MSEESPEELRRMAREARTGRKACGSCRVEQHVSASGWACDEDGCDDPGQHPSDCSRNVSDDDAHNDPRRG